MARGPDAEFLPNTSYAVLGLLSFDRELSGYEVKRAADSTLRFFYWAPAMSQVYAQLDRLTELGYVADREVPGQGTRITRVFRITSDGRRELQRWLDGSPVDPPVLKHTVALRLFLGHLAEPERLRAMLEDHRRRSEQALAELDEMRAQYSGDPTWRFARAVAEWGERYLVGEIEATERAQTRVA